jgi:hypothetical protein
MVVVTMWYLRQDGKHVTSTLKKSNALDNFDLAKRCKHKKTQMHVFMQFHAQVFCLTHVQTSHFSNPLPFLAMRQGLLGEEKKAASMEELHRQATQVPC